MRIRTRSTAVAPAHLAPAPSSGPSADSAAGSAADFANTKRRRFLFTLGLGGAGVAVSAAASVSAVTEAPDTSAVAPDGGYRETEHVRDYYRTAKL